MTAEKPADDGALHGPRRDDTQLPNRAVYIALKNDVGRKTKHRRASPRDAGRGPPAIRQDVRLSYATGADFRTALGRAAAYLP